MYIWCYFYFSLTRLPVIFLNGKSPRKNEIFIDNFFIVYFLCFPTFSRALKKNNLCPHDNNLNNLNIDFLFAFGPFKRWYELLYKHLMHLWLFSKSKFNLKSDRVNLVAPASPIECLLYLPNVQAIQYKLGPKRLTWLGNPNVLWLPVKSVQNIYAGKRSISCRPRY